MEREPYTNKMEMDGQLFMEVWYESQSWFNYKESVCNFFKDKAAGLHLNSIESFMSIGPGFGTIEKEIIGTCMPRLEHFIAVDTTSEFLSPIKENFPTAFPKVQIRCINETMQAFQGPENPVQLIMFCHSIYYAADDLEKMISRALQWLTPDGALVIIIIVERENNFIGQLREAVVWADLGIFAKHVKEALENMKLKFEEYDVHMPTTVNISHGKEGYFSIFLNRKCRPEEAEIMSEVLDKFWNRETGDVGMEQTVFIIRKPGTG